MLLVAAAKALRHLSSQLVILVLLVDFSRRALVGALDGSVDPLAAGEKMSKPTLPLDSQRNFG